MANGKFIGYVRVSTDKQGKSGLGIEAQRREIRDYLNGGSWELIQEYVEVESGKLNERQELQKALNHCKVTGATLVIAKLDRLSRDSHFIGSVMKSGIEFVAVDMPTANKFTVHIYAALAEQEREMISQRTKAALLSAKQRGTVLGNPKNLNKEASAKGRVLGVKAIQEKANSFASETIPIVRNYVAQGMSLNQIARELNKTNILTARGKTGSWTPTAVRNLMLRQGCPS